MKNLLHKITFFCFVFYTLKSFALEDGDVAIRSTVYIENSKTSISLAIVTFQQEHSFQVFRAVKKSDWKIAVLNKTGKIVDSAYLEPQIIDGPDLSKEIKLEDTASKSRRYKPTKFPYEWAVYVTRYSKEAHKFQLLYRGKLMATKLVEFAEDPIKLLPFSK